MIKKDWHVYYTLEESRARSDKRIRENAKKFAQKVLKKQQESGQIVSMPSDV